MGKSRRPRRQLAWWWAVMAVAGLLAAREADAQAADSIALDTLRVEVVRTGLPLRLVPAAVSSIRGADIATGRPGIGLDEVLGPVPGAHIANRENLALGSRITVRGFGARAAFGVRGVRIVADGIPLTVADGQSTLNNLDLARAERVEVLRGPASALYGNAAGGVILVESRAPPADPSLGARFMLGDDARGSLGAFRRIDAEAAGPLGPGGYTIAASHLQRDGPREHAAAEQTTLQAQLERRLGGSTRLRAVLNAADVPEALNPGSLPADSARLRPEMAWPNNVRTGSGESARQVQGGFTVDHAGAAVDARISAWGARRTLENPIPVAFIALERTTGGVRTQAGRALGRLRIDGGIEVELQRDHRAEWDNDGGERGSEQRRDQDDRVTAVGPYLRIGVDVGRLHASLGGRYDRITFGTTDHLLTDGDGSGERTLAAFSPTAALLLEVTHRLTAFANVSSAFQTPTTTELANAPPEAREPCCPTGFNSRLEPERTMGGELGVRGELGGRVAIDAAIYGYAVNDAIVSFQVEGIEERSFFRNAGETRHRGWELGVTAAPGAAVRMRAALSRTDVEFVDDGDPTVSFEGRKVPGIAPWRVFADARWSGPVTIELELEHTRGYYADDANSAASFVRAATTLGTRVHGSFALSGVRIEPFVTVRNLTDERYVGSVAINAFGGRYFEPAAGRSVLLGAAIPSRAR